MKKLFIFLLLAPFSAFAANTATLTWVAPTTNTDGTPLSGACSYNVYQGLSATTLTKTATGISTLTYAVSTGLIDGTQYFFSVSCTVGGIESAQSNVGSKTFSPGTPSVPTTLTVQ